MKPVSVRPAHGSSQGVDLYHRGEAPQSALSGSGTFVAAGGMDFEGKRTCAGYTKRGTPCQAAPIGDLDVCVGHRRAAEVGQ
jgi:hypothetical protein